MLSANIAKTVSQRNEKLRICENTTKKIMIRKANLIGNPNKKDKSKL